MVVVLNFIAVNIERGRGNRLLLGSSGASIGVISSRGGNSTTIMLLLLLVARRRSGCSWSDDSSTSAIGLVGRASNGLGAVRSVR